MLLVKLSSLKLSLVRPSSTSMSLVRSSSTSMWEDEHRFGGHGDGTLRSIWLSLLARYVVSTTATTDGWGCCSCWGCCSAFGCRMAEEEDESEAAENSIMSFIPRMPGRAKWGGDQLIIMNPPQFRVFFLRDSESGWSREPGTWVWGHAGASKTISKQEGFWIGQRCRRFSLESRFVENKMSKTPRSDPEFVPVQVVEIFSPETKCTHRTGRTECLIANVENKNTRVYV